MVADNACTVDVIALVVSTDVDFRAELTPAVVELDCSETVTAFLTSVELDNAVICGVFVAEDDKGFWSTTGVVDDDDENEVPEKQLSSSSPCWQSTTPSQTHFEEMQ